jgi:hypothetical protein
VSCSRSKRLYRVILSALAVGCVSTPASAHAGVTEVSPAPPVPTWLTVLTGGVVVAISFLFTSLMTDHEAMRTINGLGRSIVVPDVLATGGRIVLGAVGIGGLLAVVTLGALGPGDAAVNAGLLLVWVGWWAGYPMTVYLGGNTWPALNPWRTIAAAFPAGGRGTYPERLGRWPAVAGLLTLVWLEVASPISEEPRVLVAVVLAYSLVTITGAWWYGPTWFEHVDPIAGAFRAYGRVAPIQREDGRVTLSLPGTAVTDSLAAADTDDVAFVVGLLWITTFDGLLSTPPWQSVADTLATFGIPRALPALVALLVGFGVFLGVYRLAARLARQRSGTHVTAGYIEGWFASALLPIAVGYHFAHFLGYVITGLPALTGALAAPLAGPATVTAYVLPDWFGLIQLGIVLLGHVLAIWLAHALAFELFPGRLAPIRSQYPFLGAMVLYTMTSVWVIAQPSAATTLA